MTIEDDRKWIQGLFPGVKHGIKVSYTERDSHILIIAPHGRVDEHSQQVARILADEMNASFYECLYSKYKYKIRSIYFHPPFLTELLRNVKYAVAIYSCDGNDVIIGGRILAVIRRGLRRILDAHYPISRRKNLGAWNPDNFINDCKYGIQIELPLSIRETPENRELFAARLMDAFTILSKIV